MRQLRISMEREGIQVPVGMITGNKPTDACFTYDTDYLERADAVPISVMLPLQEAAFDPERTRRYFDGLLPEGFTRRCVAQWLREEEGDYLSLLAGLGRECLGALMVTEDGAAPDLPDYRRLSEEEMRALAREGAMRSASIVTRSHLSLAGASGKVGLYYDPAEGTWYQPVGCAPSTHIVKQSHVRLEGIVANELLCLAAARKLGIDVVESFLVDPGVGTDENVLFATRRYDRKFVKPKEGGPLAGQAERPGNVGSTASAAAQGQDKAGASESFGCTDIIRGLPVPRRLHQEDMAQALGIPAERKYEKDHAGYLNRMFRLLRACSADPMRDQLKLWDTVVFHYLIGNTDGHIKNFSLLYSDSLRTCRLAPAYDVVSTAVYESSTREMALSIGGQYDLGRIDRKCFEEEAARAGLGRAMAMKRLDRLADGLERALRDAAEELTQQGLPGAEDLRERILEKGGYRNL